MNNVPKKHPGAVALGKLRMRQLTDEEKAALGRKGGLKGGKARAKALNAAKRKEIAQKAAAKRWGKKEAK